MSAPQVIVVGGGIAGIACARALTAAGVSVVVRDRGRRLGGRMAVRHHDGRPVDTGASYFTVSAPEFEAVVDDWQRRGLARPWTDTFAARDAEGVNDKQGGMRWSAPAGLRSLVEDLASGLDVRGESVVATVGRSRTGLTVDADDADAVVLAMPDPQAARLLGDDLAEVRDALDGVSDPVLALTAAWPARTWPARDGIFVNDSEVIDFVADDGRRRGDDAPVLVAHSSPAFARPRLEDPDAAAAPMLAELRRVAEVGGDAEPAYVSVQRWSFAKPADPHEPPYLLSDVGAAGGGSWIGVCGDGWGGASKVEAAYLSGHRLGGALADRLA